MRNIGSSNEMNSFMTQDNSVHAIPSEEQSKKVGLVPPYQKGAVDNKNKGLNEKNPNLFASDQSTHKLNR